MTDPSAPARSRLLHVTRNLPPLRGGMERLNLHIALELARRYDVCVVGPPGCRAALPPAIAVREVPAAPLWRFMAATLAAVIGLARRVRPAIVLAGSGLAAPFAWIAARVAAAPFAVYVHGLDLIVPNRVYRWCWLPFIRRADLCIANSRHTAQLAAAAGVPAERIHVVHPGVELPSGTPPDAGGFRARFGLARRPLLLSVGRLIARKGLLEFVENALPAIARTRADVCLVVLGDEIPALLHGSSAGLGDRIRARAAELGLARNVMFVGAQDDATLAAAYAAADVHVFPVRDVAGDVEGFGMVAVEAAAHGLPTVAFDAGGVPDAVQDGVSGRLVRGGDYAGFAQATLDVLGSAAAAAERERARRFAAGFSWTLFGERLRAIITQASGEAGSSDAAD